MGLSANPASGIGPEQPLVSVALPVFNGARYIERAIRSVLEQTYPCIELLVRDDDSTDRTAEIVRSFDDPRLRYSRNETRLGQFGNFNACLSDAKGVYAHLFAYDDIMEPQVIATQMSYLRRYPDAAMSYCGVRNIDANERFISDSSKDTTPVQIDRTLYLYLAAHHGALPAAISTVFVRMDALREAGFFDPRFKVAGDLELWNRIADRHRIVHVPEILIHVRSHSDQVTNLSLTGYHYIQDEIGISRWFRERIRPAVWKKVYSYRMRTRGVNHFEWVLKRLLRGDFRTFREALKALRAEYPLMPLFFLYVLTLGNRIRKSGPVPFEEFREAFAAQSAAR